MHSCMLVGGGFLLGVLWMDLMFDVQALRHPARAGDLPEPVLASIAGYYRRVTTDAAPMGHLVGAIMLATLLSAALALARGTAPRPLRVAPILLAGAPVALAALRVFPAAVRLGARRDPPAGQTALARAILRDHLACLAAMLAFVATVAASGR